MNSPGFPDIWDNVAMPDRLPSKIVYLTAGAGGMYCGSCMHDNHLARSMLSAGVDVQLVPLYMPIRTDMPAVTVDRVFFGGLNVYLQQKTALFRHLPVGLTGFLDNPRLLRWLGKRQVTPSSQMLGGLTHSMLRGEEGRQRAEVRRLAQWLQTQACPDMVLLTNVLIAGCVPALKRALNRPVLVLLQGDDIFLESLAEPYRSRVLAEIRRLADQIDGFLVHSQYYADFMADYLTIPRTKIHRVPLGLDLTGFLPTMSPDPGRDDVARPDATRDGCLTVGYLARLAPEKGLHLLVDALLQVGRQVGPRPLKLLVAGWLGDPQRAYAEQQFEKLRQAGWGDSFEYLGTVSREEKLSMLGRLDLFSVPATYREPKGLYVLEALAAGVPVVLPDHGAFPEIVSETGGGVLFSPNDPAALAGSLVQLLTDTARRRQLGRTGHAAVHERRDMKTIADGTLAVLSRWMHD